MTDKNYRILRRYQSTRHPEVVFTVREDVTGIDIHQSYNKADVLNEWRSRLSCDCAGYKFCKEDEKFCRHTQELYMELKSTHATPETLWSTTLQEFRATEIGKTIYGRARAKNTPKRRLAESLVAAGLNISNHGFRKLLRELRPYLHNEPLQRRSQVFVDSDDVLRVIEFDN